MASFLFVALHALLMLGVIIRVLLRRPARGVALAWLLLTVALPYVGAAAYFLIGERRIARGRAERIRTARADFRRIARIEADGTWPGTPAPAAAAEPQAKAAAHFFGIPPLAGNSLALHAETPGILRAIAADIDAARRSVLIEFYIWQAGGLTGEVLDALLRAAGRGVECLVLVDAMGAGKWWSGSEPARLRAAGVKLRPALPVGLIRGLAGRTDLRLHRKIVAVDGAIAWTGSMNMVDPRFFKQDAGVGEWVDAMVRVEGPAAVMLAAVMAGDWLAEGGDSLADVVARAGLSVPPPMGRVPVQVIPSGPGESGDGLLQVMLGLIGAAERELVLTTPYFVPEDALIIALRGAAARGVRLTIILPRRIDSLLVRYASRSFFDEVLEAGGDILEFRDGLLHTKSITVDGRVALFGTANFDMRSLWLNYEVSLLVHDPGFAGAVRALQARYMAVSDPVSTVPWTAQPVGQRLVSSAMRLVSPLL